MPCIISHSASHYCQQKAAPFHTHAACGCITQHGLMYCLICTVMHCFICILLYCPQHYRHSLLEITDEQLLSTFSTNIFGQFFMTQVAATVGRLLLSRDHCTGPQLLASVYLRSLQTVTVVLCILCCLNQCTTAHAPGICLMGSTPASIDVLQPFPILFPHPPSLHPPGRTAPPQARLINHQHHKCDRVHWRGVRGVLDMILASVSSSEMQLTCIQGKVC